MMALRKYQEIELRGEINAVLDRLQAAGQVMRPQWVAVEVVESHRGGLIADEESWDVAFWTYSGYTIARKLATQCINERDGGGTQRDRQQTLPYDGFSRVLLQDYYVIERDGEDVAVPTRDLTDEEIETKVALFRSQSRTLDLHAAELERYKDWRRAA